MLKSYQLRIKIKTKEIQMSLKDLSGVADVVAKIMAEQLKGQQHQIDKNKNNKIDGQDFAILRGEKKAIKEEDAYDKDRYAVKNGKAVKDNPAHMGSKDEPHHVWAKSADEALKKKMKEEVEQIDELKKSTLQSYYKKSVDRADDLGQKHKEAEINRMTGGKQDTPDEYKKRHIEIRKRERGQDNVEKRLGTRAVKKMDKEGGYERIGGYGSIKQNKSKFSEEVELEEGIEDRLEAARAKAKAAGKPIKDKPTPPKSNVRKIEGSAYGGAKQKDEPEEDDDDTPAKKTVKYGARQNYKRSTRVNESFTEMLTRYDQEGLKFVADTLVEEPTEEEFNAEIKKAQDKSEGKDKAEVAKASVQAVKNEEVEVIDADEINGVEEVTIDERHMSDAEMNKREKIVKSMKKGLSGFKQRYGDRAKNVMYATATKQAMKD
mgnify:CR=1 FL=1